MTKEQFDKLRPGHSVLQTEIDGVPTKVLLKFFLYHHDTEDYSLCTTKDLTNPYPDKIVESDWETYSNLSEVIEF